MVRHQQQVAAIVATDTNIAGVHVVASAVGDGGSGESGTAHSSASSRSASALSADEIVDELRAEAARHARACTSFMQNPPAIQIGGRASKSLYQFTLQSADIATLYPAAQQHRSADADSRRSCRTSRAICRSTIRR